MEEVVEWANVVLCRRVRRMRRGRGELGYMMNGCGV